MRLRAVLTIVAVALLLGSCTYTQQITVSGSPERPTVTIKPARRGLLSTTAVGVDSLTISDLTKLRAEQETSPVANPSFAESSARWRKSLAWNIAQSSACNGPTRIEYGTPPPGFRELPEPGAARPLVEDHIYAVSVSGCGLHGAGVFKISRGRLIFAKREVDLH